jgi:histidinol-phosphatase
MNDLTLAQQLADIADQVSLARFRASDLVIDSKPDLTPVSDADKKIEQLIREHLLKVSADDGVIGEEFENKASTNNREWILDPIDGTKNYIRGVPIWATLIALRQNNEITCTVVSAPAINRRWYASKGEGAYVVENILGKEEKRKLKVSAVSKISDASFAFAEVIKKDNWEDYYDKFLKLTNDVWRSRGFGDFWGHMLVAEGAVDIAVEPKLALWDMAALYLIVKEAGGSFTNLAGIDGVDGPGAISSNTLLHKDLLARFA